MDWAGYLWMGLIGGMAAFPHCLGMCGGFALHLAGGGSKAALLARQLLWHAGRTVTYVFLGALAGFLGAMVSLASWPAGKDLPGYIAGGIMVVMGLFVLGLAPARRHHASADPGDAGLFGSIFGRFFQRPAPLSAFVLGLANGFLPCPITLGFLALAAGGGSVLLGMGIMAAMGLGTAWALLVLGLTGHVIRTGWKRWGSAVVGITLVLMGAWTVMRKAKLLPPLPGMHIPACHAFLHATSYDQVEDVADDQDSRSHHAEEHGNQLQFEDLA